MKFNTDWRCPTRWYCELYTCQVTGVKMLNSWNILPPVGLACTVTQFRDNYLVMNKSSLDKYLVSHQLNM